MSGIAYKTLSILIHFMFLNCVTNMLTFSHASQDDATAIAIRLSVLLSVTVTLVIHAKTAQHIETGFAAYDTPNV